MSQPHLHNLPPITFQDSKAVTAKPEFYTGIEIDICAILKSWQLSIFSFEWLNQDGSVKTLEDLKDSDRDKRMAIEEAVQMPAPLDAPVLGIGILGNVEIGSGKAVLCTLAALGVKSMAVHIPQSNVDDFQEFLA